MKAEKLSYVIIPVLVVILGLTGFFYSDGAGEVSDPVVLEDAEFYGIQEDGLENLEDEILNSLEGKEEVEFVNELDNMETLIYLHQYSTGGPVGPSAKEYIVVLTSVDEDSSRTAVFRLGFENKEVIDSHKGTVNKVEDLNKSDVIATIENETSGYQSVENIAENDINKIGLNYAYTRVKPDVGSFTMVINEYTGEPVFYGTTIGIGTGNVVIPEELARDGREPSDNNGLVKQTE